MPGWLEGIITTAVWTLIIVGATWLIVRRGDSLLGWPGKLHGIVFRVEIGGDEDG